MSSENRVTSYRRTDVAKLKIASAILWTRPKKNRNKKKSPTGSRVFLIHKGIAVSFLFQKGKSFRE